MGNWLDRLRGKAKPAPLPVVAAAAPARASTAQGVAAWKPGIDVDVEFWRLLQGEPGERADTATPPERACLQDVTSRAASAGVAALVPRVPAVVPQVLQTLRDASRPMSVLARQLSQDPVLVAGVLKLARSPFHGLQQPVASLEQALLVVGQDGLRQMLAAIAFRPIINLQAGPATARGAPRLWDQTERCGLACQVLSPAAGVSAFETFLAAILHSVGSVVVLRLLDQALPGTTGASSEACRTLGAQARTLACRIGREWSFPEPVIRAVAERESPSAHATRTALGDLVRACDALSKLRVLVDAQWVAPDEPTLGLAGHETMQRCFRLLDAAAD